MKKPPPTSKERIDHVLGAIEWIEKFMIGIDLESFIEDNKLNSAIQYHFLIIGEAIRHVDSDILEKYPYPWHIPRSFRNFIIHGYHGIKLERIFNASGDLQELKSVLLKIRVEEF